MHPNSSVVASASPDNTIKIWDIKAGKMINDVKAHNSKVYCVQYSDDGNQLISSGGDKTVHIWDTKKIDKPLMSFTCDCPYVTS